MNSDCAFRLGKTHRICQDYAVAGPSGEETHVLLADGCSGSPDTDIGARMLVKSAERLLPTHRDDWEAYHAEAVRQAAECAALLGLAPTCLDATLLTIKAAHGAFTAACYGDGLIALGRRDGRLEVYEVAFAANYPRYASYRLDDTRQAQWEGQTGNEKGVTHWLLGPGGVETKKTCRSQRAFETWTGTAADYRFAAVLSDGIQSFTQMSDTETSRTMQIVPVPDILAALLAFKGSRGEFVQRRAQAFWKECGVHRWQHSDDLALAVVWLEENP